MRELSAGGTTVVIVSHERELVTAVCDRGVLIQDGAVVGDGPIDAVVDAYMQISTGDTPR
jgi:ABC-type polysaccharide/polyol phosphate transport system ATPase subunit